MNESQAILITGGAKRIGRAIALRLAQEGYDIALHYHQSEEQAQQTAAEIRALGRRCELLQANLSQTSEALALPQRAKETLPNLAGLIISASIFAPSPFESSNEALLERYMQLHVTSSFFLAQSFAKRVKAGSIITLLDTNVKGHASVHFTYLLSKKALAELTGMLARELAPAIRVNAIAPGLTSLSDDVTPQQAAEKAATLPLQRIAQPGDIADAAAYVLRAEYLTGHTLFIDGGQQLL